MSRESFFWQRFRPKHCWVADPGSVVQDGSFPWYPGCCGNPMGEMRNWKTRMEGRREKSCLIVVRWDVIFLKIYCFEVPEGLVLVRH